MVIPTSDVDLVVLDSGVPDGQRAAALQRLAHHLVQHGIAKQMEVIAKVRVRI